MTADERKVSFHHKKVGPRAAIVAAGPIANFLLAIVIFAALFTFFGKPSQTARVDSIQENSAAATAGFKSGDIVTAINGDAIESFTEMQRIVSTKAGVPLVFTVKRGDEVVKLNGTPQLREIKDNFGNVHRVGIRELPVPPVPAIPSPNL
jgi:regulator of sigma E protease